MPTPATLAKLYRAVLELEAAYHEHAEHVQVVLNAVREYCHDVSVRRLANQADVYGANLAHILSGRRKPSREMLAKLEAALSSE